jgi:hypothetical protein
MKVNATIIMTLPVQRCTKSVTFADGSENTSHIYEARATDILWEFPEFFEKSREAARKAGKRLRQDGHAGLLDDCYSSTRNDIQKRLNEFVMLVDDGRGVERYVSKSMGITRREERSRAIKAIVIVQTQAKQIEMSSDVLAKRLREISLVCCLNAKVYARRMGKADEAACYPRKKSSTSNDNTKAASTHGRSTCEATNVMPSIAPARMA